MSFTFTKRHIDMIANAYDLDSGIAVISNYQQCDIAVIANNVTNGGHSHLLSLPYRVPNPTVSPEAEFHLM